jgi:hypothetical protein
MSVIAVIVLIYLLLRFIFKPDNNGTHIHDSDRVDEETKEFIIMYDLRRHWEERHHDEL